MSLKSRIARLERLIEAPSETAELPFLTRDEMAVFIPLRVKRFKRSKPKKRGKRTAAGGPKLPPEELERLAKFVDRQLQKANTIKAEGRLPEVLARLRAKGAELD